MKTTPIQTKTTKNLEHQPKVILPHILIYNTLRAYNYKGRINAADIHSSLYIDCKHARQNHSPLQGVPNLASDEVITTFYSGVVEDLIAAWDALPGKNFLYFIGSLQAIIVFLLISNKLIMTNILKNENCQFMLPATAILLLATYLQYTIDLAR